MNSSLPFVVRDATAEELGSWDEIVRRFPNYRFTHLMAWIRSLEHPRRARPLFLIAERNREIVGCIPGILLSVGPLRLFGSPLVGSQTVSLGPAYDPARVSTRELIDVFATHVEQCHGVHHLELISSVLDTESMQELGFRGEEMVTYRAPLFPDDEARAFRALKDNARRNVRRAERLGLTVRFEHGPDFVAEHYAQIAEVFARGGNRVPFSESRVRQFVDHMHDAGCLLGVSVLLPDGVTRIATGTFTVAAGELVLWMWAHRTQARWYRPTELMTWTAMRHAMAAGCTSVDFMGAGDFKGVFGATPDNRKQRWIRSRVPFLLRARDLAYQGYRWQQGARGRLARARLERAGTLDDATRADSLAARRPLLAGPLTPKDILRALFPGRPGVADTT